VPVCHGPGVPPAATGEGRGEARQQAAEALAIADRSEYRLKQAEIHNFLAGWHLALSEAEGVTLSQVEGPAGGDVAQARHRAELAKERAWCDGPPHCYQPALDEAEQLLEEIGAGG
jgi:hypothetical protein